MMGVLPLNSSSTNTLSIYLGWREETPATVTCFLNRTYHSKLTIALSKQSPNKDSLRRSFQSQERSPAASSHSQSNSDPKLLYTANSSQSNADPGTSLAVQCLRLCASIAKGMASTPGQGTEIPCMACGVAEMIYNEPK